jgi:hypothetical protein
MLARSKRDFLKFAAASAAAIHSTSMLAIYLASGTVAGAAPKRDKSQAATVEQWMMTWMEDRKKAPGAVLHVSRFREPIYFVTQPGVAWKPNPGQVGKYEAVEVPVGFVTDFASIPRVFWSLLRPDGEYTYPAIVHDYMYWMQDRPREVADDIFRFGMQDFQIDKVTTTAIYQAVRRFGQSAWDENAALKRRREKRILKKYPTDPRERWTDWKENPDNFM